MRSDIGKDNFVYFIQFMQSMGNQFVENNGIGSTEASFCPSQPLKIKKKYSSNYQLVENQKVKNLEREVRHLKQYTQQLENRLLILIKAQGEDNPIEPPGIRQRANTHRVDIKLAKQIGLLKYATNEIKVYDKGEDTFMSLRQTFRDQPVTINARGEERRKMSSFPKHKEYKL